MLSRRSFLRRVAGCAPLLAGTAALVESPGRRAAAAEPDDRKLRLRELTRTAPRARYWIGLDSRDATCASCHERAASADIGDGTEDFEHPPRAVKCLLCAQECMLGDGARGKCRARLNVAGELRSLVYGRPLSVNVDPIEKKPFYHFLPGSRAFSISTAGCPLGCKFCQNWEISQASPEDYATSYVKPEAVVEAASTRKAPVIAFTYNEPTVFTEYLTDVARIAREGKERCVLISCGYMKEEPLDEMCDVLHAIKIDLKGFSEDFYRDVAGASLKPVLRSLRQIHRRGVHLEIVNLVVPTLNDSETMLRGLVDWIAGELGPDVPVHFTRFHPDYKLRNLPPTPVSTLERAREIALEKGLRYPFVGNVADHPGNHTYCPACKKAVVRRTGMFLGELSIKDGACAFCGEKIAGVWS